MRIIKEYSFNRGMEILEAEQPSLLAEVRQIIYNLDVSDCRDKESKETTKVGELLYSPVKMNAKFKQAFEVVGWDTQKRIRCRYKTLGSAPDHVVDVVSKLYTDITSEYQTKMNIKTKISQTITQIPKDLFKTCSANKLMEKLKEQERFVSTSTKAHKLDPNLSIEELIEYITPDFTGYREMDAVKEKVGVEVQFGKYAFMVYNVCAKMTIFHKHEIIDYGIEIVPVKSLQRDMSTGVAFFEQFVWDLDERGVSNLDIPVLIIGIEAG
jgi:hypothetical protein